MTSKVCYVSADKKTQSFLFSLGLPLLTHMIPTVFRYPTTLTLRDTDSAGVAFFASYFAIAHCAYESFLQSQGAGLRDWLGEVHLPIVHSQADYKAPIRLGDAFDVELSCVRLGKSSFTLNYRFLNAHQVLLAQLQTVHVAVTVNSQEHRATPLPDSVRALLEMLLYDVPKEDNS